MIKFQHRDRHGEALHYYRFTRKLEKRRVFQLPRIRPWPFIIGLWICITFLSEISGLITTPFPQNLNAFNASTPRLNFNILLRPDTWTPAVQLEDYITSDELLNATQIAMAFIADYWNNKSTYFPNTKALIQLNWQTNFSHTGREITLAVQYAKSGMVHGLISDSINATQGQATITSAFGIPQCNLYSTTEGLGDKSVLPSLYLLSSSVNNNAFAMVDLAWSFNWTRLGIIYENVAYCQSWYSNIISRIEATYGGNITLLFVRAYQTTLGTSTIDSVMSALAGSNARVVLSCTDSGNKLSLFKAIRTAGLFNLQWVFDQMDDDSVQSFGNYAFSYDLLAGSFFIGGSTTQSNSFNELDKLWVTRGNIQNCEGNFYCYNADSNDGGYPLTAFLYQWYTKSTKFPNYVYQIYDCLKSMVAGYSNYVGRGGALQDILNLQVLQNLSNGNNSQEILRFLNNPPVQGVSVSLLQVDEEGQVQQEKRIYCFTDVPFRQIYPGGQVVSTWFPNGSIFNLDYVSFLRTGDGSVVPSVFAGYATSPVRVTTMYHNQSLDISAAIPIGILTGVSTLFTLLALMFIYYYQDLKHIHRSTPILLFYILIGSLLCLASIFADIADPTILSCGFQIALKHIGFAVAFGALILKSFRISVIFNHDSSRVVIITNRDLLIRLFVYCGLTVVYVIVWLSIRPPTTTTQLVQISSVPDYNVYSICSNSDFEQYLFVVEFLVLLYGAVIAFQTRNAPTEYNESRYLGASIYTWFLITVVLFFVQKAVINQRIPSFIIGSLSILVTTTAMIGFVFIPKAVFTWFPPRKDFNVLEESFHSASEAPTSSVQSPLHYGSKMNDKNTASMIASPELLAPRTMPSPKLSLSAEMEKFPDLLSLLESALLSEDESKRIHAELQLLMKELQALDNKIRDSD